MYLIRRVYKVKTGNTRKAAELIYKIGKRYEDAGQRSSVKVYWSGYTVPGEQDTVYLEWIQEKIESPYRLGNVSPGSSELGAELLEIQENSHIEFYEIYNE